MKKGQKLSYLLFISIIILIMIILFTLCWKYDNKYTYSSPQAINGVLILDEENLSETPYLFLIHGWNYYADVLLTPEMIRNTPITETRFIGQYPGLETDHNTVSPHGMATYQMSMILPETQNQYALYIPEIFSAYRLYINDRLVAHHGIPDKENYLPRVQSETVLFEASGKTELLFAVSDYSHFYSGMVYPPTFGISKAVLNLIKYRVVFCVFVFSMALCLGCFHMAIGIATYKHLNILSPLFAGICFCCALIIMFPLFHTFIATGIQPWYALEFFLRAFLLFLVCFLAGALADIEKKKQRLVNIIGILFCLIALLGSVLAPYCSANILNCFSKINRFYKFLCIAWILVVSIPMLFKQRQFSRLMYSAILVFSISLIGELTLPLFEPIYFGWFSELSAIFLVLILGIVLWRDIIEQYNNNIQLSLEMQHMDAQIALQQKHYEDLTQQIEEIRQFRHDTRHHLQTIHQLSNNQNWDELQNYLSELTELSSLSTPLSFCPIYPLDALLRYYYSKAETLQISLHIQMNLPKSMQIPASDLCVIFGNLLENAFEACQMVPNQKEIYLNAQMTGHMMKLEIRNIYNEKALQLNGDVYYSSKMPNREGIGLRSVQAITTKYNGILEVKQTTVNQTSWFIVQLFLGKA